MQIILIKVICKLLNMLSCLSFGRKILLFYFLFLSVVHSSIGSKLGSEWSWVQIQMGAQL